MRFIFFIPLGLFVSLALSLYCWGFYRSLYWKLKKMASIPAVPLVGNLGGILTLQRAVSEQVNDFYFDKSTKNEPLVGVHIFHKPAIVIKHPDLIKRVLVKDFANFPNRHCSSDEHTDVLGNKNLFFINNPGWKSIRPRLSPFFSSGHMKQMFHLVKNVGAELNELMVSTNINERTKSFCTEIKDISARYTIDVIASCVFGLEAKSLKFPNGDFITCGRKMFTFNLYRAVELFSVFFIPEVVPFFRFKVFSKESNDFLYDSINYAISEREKSGNVRDDLIDTLIELKNEDEGKIEDSTRSVVFQEDVLVAQGAAFFTGGFETTSTTMSVLLYEMCWNPEIQKRLRAEIKEVLLKSKGDLNYEDIQNMEYLNMVIDETLRMYPPVPYLDRECDSDQGYSLEPFDNFLIPKGMPILIPICAIQRDPQYFPKPDTFDPERFSAENKRNIVPYTLMPFGIGPRICIGERFARMQIKVGLVNILKNHYVEPSDTTPKVMELEKKAWVLQPKGGVVLNVVRDPLV